MTTTTTKRVRIVHDQDVESPREWDNVGRMVCWHRRYNLGDEQPKDSPQEWKRNLAADHVNGNEDQIPDEHVDRILEKHFIILPLYLYDHSGITMSCAPFSCPWDSGQVGYIYCTKQRGIAECTTVENAEKCLQGEVKVYDQYLRGDVYGFVVEEYDDLTGWSHVDSCCGFYGSDPRENGMAEYLDAELTELACKAEVEY